MACTKVSLSLSLLPYSSTHLCSFVKEVGHIWLVDWGIVGRLDISIARYHPKGKEWLILWLKIREEHVGPGVEA